MTFAPACKAGLFFRATNAAKKMAAYYNEIDPYAAAWLRNLIAAGHIAPGDVDERSIEDVRLADLLGYTQCHFFAGIGVWSYALRSAGWSDERPVWTGSCPCQPFSAAGKRGGTADERHLWPAWEWLIRHAKPRGVPVLGEQVASKDGLAWFDLVHADLEGQDYTVRALDLCAAGVGAPHIRQRLWFVADADGREPGDGDIQRGGQHGQQSQDGSAGRLAESDGAGPHGSGLRLQKRQRASRGVQSASTGSGTLCGGFGSQRPSGSRMADAAHVGEHRSGHGGTGRRGELANSRVVGDACVQGLSQRISDGQVQREALVPSSGQTTECRSAINGYWRDADWLPCIDGKARPVEPGTFPLAHGAPARVGRLRAYGNAIVAPVAIEFIRAYLAESALSSLR